MTSILPPGRSSFDVIGQQIGQALQQNMQPSIQQGYQRQLGMNALDRAEQAIKESNGDPYKIALAFARAGAQNPNLERSLGPLAQTAMTNAKVNRAFPNQQGGGTGQSGQPQENQAISPGLTQISPPSDFAKPSAFNVMTADQINSESERYAQAVNDPNAYQTRQAQLNNQNNIATQQREALEDMALKSDIKPSELSRFMQIGSQFDSRNPSEWMVKAKRKYNEVKAADDSLQRAFIPGTGTALLGGNREKHLKKLENDVQEKVKNGLEDETRTFLANNYVTPTEIESLIHPLTPEKEKAINALPRGIFPAKKAEKYELGQFYTPENPFVSYEEAREKAPKEMQAMQNKLADFFLNNVDDKTSLLVLRDKLWNDRDYDWRQVGPAIKQAMEKGLTLNPRQQAELTDVNTQAPYQSLPEIFQDLDRVWKFFRGNK
jgi:hypothetical protein